MKRRLVMEEMVKRGDGDGGDSGEGDGDGRDGEGEWRITCRVVNTSSLHTPWCVGLGRDKVD